MNLHEEDLDSGGDGEKTWNYCHPSGHVGQVTDHYGNCLLWFREFSINGKKHRDGDLPALETFEEDGHLYESKFFKNGQLHRPRELGPAVICYDEDGSGSISESFYFEHDKIVGIGVLVDGQIVFCPTDKDTYHFDGDQD